MSARPRRVVERRGQLAATLKKGASAASWPAANRAHSLEGRPRRYIGSHAEEWMVTADKQSIGSAELTWTNRNREALIDPSKALKD